MRGHGDTTDWAQGSPLPMRPSLARPRGSDAVPGSTQTTCGTALWPTAPATVARGPRQRRACTASTGKPRHPMITGVPVSPAAPQQPLVALGSAGQWGTGWGQCGGNGDSVWAMGTAWGQGGQHGGKGDSAGAMAPTGGGVALWLCWPWGEGLLAVLLPTPLPAGSCRPPAMDWRRITAETLTGTSGARGVTLSTPTSGTRAAASRSVRTVSAAGRGCSVPCPHLPTEPPGCRQLSA